MPYSTASSHTCAHCEAPVRRVYPLLQERRGARGVFERTTMQVCRLCYLRLAGIEPHRAGAAVRKLAPDLHSTAQGG